MTIHTPTPGNAPGLPFKTIADLHTDVVRLEALLQGAEILSEQSDRLDHKHAGNALFGLFPEILIKVEQLAADLERIDRHAAQQARGTATIATPFDESPVTESRLPGESVMAARALEHLTSELQMTSGGDPFPTGLRDALITLIENNTAKVEALVKYTDQIERRLGA